MKVVSINHIAGRQRDEFDIITRILKGEKELYEILVRRNNQKLYRVVRTYLKEEEEIEDVMQNTYLIAYEKLKQFRHSSGFSTWLIRIAINEALARLKQKDRMRPIGDRTDDSHVPILAVQYHEELTPDKHVIRGEMKQMLEKAIDSLDQTYRAVYVFKEVEGLSIQEVAECLEISPANVKVRLHRARGLLRDKLLELANDAEVFQFGGDRCGNLTEKVMSRIE